MSYIQTLRSLTSEAPQTATISTSTSRSLSQPSSIGPQTAINSCRYVITDFAIIRASVEDIDIFNDGDYDLRVSDITVPLVFEIERNTDQTENGCENVVDILKLLVKARSRVIKQAAYAFAMYPHMETLIALAASGLW